MTTKHCNRCDQHLPLDAFSWSSSSPDNRQGMCKSCNREYCRGIWQERKAQYMAAREAKKSPQELCRKLYRQALKAGVLKKGVCECCGSHHKVEGHHDDYRYPLKVRWLCQVHHRELHRKSNERAA